MLTSDAQVKVLDFGLAMKVEGGRPADGGTAALRLTESGIALGTPGYLSPEQARGEAVDHRADVFAFGCVLYECLTGRRAFRGDTVADVLAAVLRDEPEWSVLPADTPDA